MNLINIRATSGGAYAPCSADLEDDAGETLSFRQSGQAFRRRYLHMLFRETLKDYRTSKTEWMRRASRTVLANIYENYRETWSKQ